MNELIEKLAAEAHDVWAGWHKYQMSCCKQEIVCGLESSNDLMRGAMMLTVIPKNKQERWDGQANTPYNELPESEKESDREIAKRYLDCLTANEDNLQVIIEMFALKSLPEGYEICKYETRFENSILVYSLYKGWYKFIETRNSYWGGECLDIYCKPIIKQSNDNWKQILKDREQQTYTDKANEKTRKDFYNDCL